MTVVGLLCFCVGFLFGFVETDAFALHKALQGGGSIYYIFNVWNYGDNSAKLYFLFFSGALVASLAFVNAHRLRNYQPVIATLSVVMLVLVACLRLVMDEGIFVAIAGTEMRSFLPIMFIPLSVYCMAVWAPRALKMFARGFFGALVIKAVVLMPGYYLSGGLPFYHTVSAVVDGGVLFNFSIGVLAFSGFALCRYRTKADTKVVCLVGCSILFFFLIMASYRRGILIRTCLSFMLASIILLFVQGKLWRLLPRLLIFAIVSIAGVIGCYIAIFGADLAGDRLFSLWGASEKAELGDSNRYYEDDQATLLEVFRKSHGLGVGLRKEYGTSFRLGGASDETEYAVTEIPLHTGVYELLARVGIFAVPFIVTVFVVLPLSSIRWLKVVSLEWQVVGAIAAAWLLVNGLWPYAPPPYTNQSIWISFGVAIGLLAASQIKALHFQDGPAKVLNSAYAHQSGSA